MKNVILACHRSLTSLAIFLTLLINSSCSTAPAATVSIPQDFAVEAKPEADTPSGKKKVKMALLLDTSNSMDGLIDQAKSQLWKFVNSLSSATYQGEVPSLEIALYEYGNDGLSKETGYVRQVSMFSSDLDHVSEMLFSLSTNGGSEYCGQVIQTSLSQLDWQGDDADMRVIFIAGNEEFDQGRVDYEASCLQAKEKDVVVNTIFCGNFSDGISMEWKKGADLSSGSYMSIDQDSKTVFVDSPFDIEIENLNVTLNATYIYYGRDGMNKKMNQESQDRNASLYGSGNVSNRAISKAGSFYSNTSWDLVDAANEKDFDPAKIKEADWPEILKGKPLVERNEYIAKKSAEREVVKSQINELSRKRSEYISRLEKTERVAPSLDDAMLKALKDQATKKGFTLQ